MVGFCVMIDEIDSISGIGQRSISMSQYKEARERTKTKIRDACWDLLMNDERLTVKKITGKAGIHKSTFYFYYECADDVLKEIKARLMDELVSAVESQNRADGDFQQVMAEMRKTFRENRKYLVPLVLEQRGGDFAVRYREYIKEHLAEDIGLDYRTGNDVKNDVANCVLAGLVEMMLYELSSEIIPDEFTYKIGYGIIQEGVSETLGGLNIRFGN